MKVYQNVLLSSVYLNSIFVNKNDVDLDMMPTKLGLKGFNVLFNQTFV